MYLSINTSLNEPLHYLIASQVNMQINRLPILQQRLEQEISYEFAEKDVNEAYSVLLKHTAYPDNFPTYSGNTKDVSRLLNIPYESLLLKLETNGELKEILNQSAIAEKWEKVKESEEFRQFLACVDEKRFLQEIDLAYENSLWYICTTPHYIVFFPPVYRTTGYPPVPSVRYTLSYNSIIFAGNIIRFKVQFDLNRTENGFTFFKSKTLKWDADEGKMRKMYEKGYATAIQSPWKGYSFEYEAVHKYEQRTGRLVEANAVFREQANENLIYENRIDIRIKTD